MAPITRISTSGNRGDGVDPNTKNYVNNAMEEIRHSIATLTNTIVALEGQNNQMVNGWLGRQANQFNRQFVKIISDNVGWEMYKTAIIQRFRYVFEDPMAALKNAKCEKSTKEYQDLFDTLLCRVDITTLEAVKKKNISFLSSNMGRYGSGLSYGSNSKPRLLTLHASNNGWKPKPNTPLNAHYTPGHKCSGQLYSLMVVPKEEEEYFEVEEGNEELSVQDEILQISLSGLNGSNTFQTMRVTGNVGKDKLHILIDCGSTNNFMDDSVAKRIRCQLKNTCPLPVVVGEGKQLISDSKFKDFVWQLQGETFMADIMILPLRGCEVLGIQWLAILRDIKCNFSQLKIEFVYNKRRMVLRGAPKTTLQWMEVTPHMSYDHRIPLIKRIQPVKIRPYRHPPTQKDDIKTMVKELLEAGVIKVSNSPSASPIVMVKKKDNTWRMCLDYRQLNKNTVKNKFPIPVIEELIDELHGATIFSKLDLRSGYHHIRMFEEHVAKTAFKNHEGDYEFLVMPFGL
ncbi:reverse transcriptase [Tanacetum coccineum]